MKQFCSAASFCAAFVLLTAPPAHATVDLLLNGGFESVTSGLSNGNNINVPGQPAGWTIIAGQSNIQQGSATGNGFAGANLAPYNGAFSGGTTTGTTASYNQNTDTGGNHFFDGTNDVNGFTTITQTFTLATGTNLSGSYALGIRDVGGNQAGTLANFTAGNTSRVELLNSGGSVIFVSYGDTSATGQTALGSDLAQHPTGWQVNTFAANNVPAGTYTLRVDLAGSQNLDAINVVPEPSTWGMLGLGVIGAGVVALRRRRAVA